MGRKLKESQRLHSASRLLIHCPVDFGVAISAVAVRRILVFRFVIIASVHFGTWNPAPL